MFIPRLNVLAQSKAARAFARLRLSLLPLVGLLLLGACVQTGSYVTSVQNNGQTYGMGSGAQVPAVHVPTTSGRALPAGAPILAVAARVAPVADQICRSQVRGRSCDFIIAVDDDPTAQANAYQTLDPQGRPMIVFTSGLLNMVENSDELAFVFGHEAAHHIAGHIPRRQDQAITGAIFAGVLAQIGGLGQADIQRVQEIGAGLAAQHYSKDFELEADALGAEIAWYAGYNPLRGAEFFTRLPDPGDRVLGSHPANAERRAVVAQRMAGLANYGLGQ